MRRHSRASLNAGGLPGFSAYGYHLAKGGSRTHSRQSPLRQPGSLGCEIHGFAAGLVPVAFSEGSVRREELQTPGHGVMPITGLRSPPGVVLTPHHVADPAAN